MESTLEPQNPCLYWFLGDKHDSKQGRDPEIVIQQVPREAPGLIGIQNTESDTLNRMVMTPRPRDPYLYELCPPPKFHPYVREGDPKIVIKQVPRAPPRLIRVENTEQDTLNRIVIPRGPGTLIYMSYAPPKFSEISGKS